MRPTTGAPNTPSIVAMLGSPRRNGNCATVLRAALAEAEARGCATELIHLSAHTIRYCAGHDDCGQRERCPQDDEAGAVLERLWEADGVILASPVYLDNVSGQMKVLLDRTCHDYSKGRRMKARAVGLITVAESTGLDDAIAALRRALAFIQPHALPTFVAKGYASALGDAAANSSLMESGRRLGRDMAAAVRAR
jgi:multimeric flavodoxin WrbA